MGRTGGEGFLPSFSRTHPLNGDVYEEVRDEDDQEGEKDVEANETEDNQLTDVCVGAWESQEWGHVTEKMINLIRTTEGESKGICRVDGRVEEAANVGAYGQEGTHTGRHGAGVVKRPADRCMAVVGHGGQEVALDSGKTRKEKELSSTAIVGDDFVPWLQCSHHLRGYGWWVPQVHKGQVTEEEVHWSVEAGVWVDDHHHPPIPNQSDEVDEQKHQEEGNLKIGVIC